MPGVLSEVVYRDLPMKCVNCCLVLQWRSASRLKPFGLCKEAAAFPKSRLQGFTRGDAIFGSNRHQLSGVQHAATGSGFELGAQVR
jgi:hypothetical protein